MILGGVFSSYFLYRYLDFGRHFLFLFLVQIPWFWEAFSLLISCTDTVILGGVFSSYFLYRYRDFASRFLFLFLVQIPRFWQAFSLPISCTDTVILGGVFSSYFLYSYHWTISHNTIGCAMYSVCLYIKL